MQVIPNSATMRTTGRSSPSPPLLEDPVSAEAREPSAEEPWPVFWPKPTPEVEPDPDPPDVLMSPCRVGRVGAVLRATAAAARPSAPRESSARWVDCEIALPEPPLLEPPPPDVALPPPPDVAL